MNLKKQLKYKIADDVSFFYFYEDKIGKVEEIETNGKYCIRQKSNKILYTVTLDKIYGKIIYEQEIDSSSNKSSN